MSRNGWIIFCLAYVIGLLSTNLLAFPNFGFSWQQLIVLATGLIGLSIITAIAIWRFNKSQDQYQMYLCAGIVAVLAVVYFQCRIPQPDVDDISYQVRAENSELITVTGKVLTEPRLNANQRLKFWLKTIQVETGFNNQENVSGKLYVTVPLLQGTGIYPGENIKVKGVLYLPQAANNPGSFDFKAYLARQGIFAGLQGLEIIISDRNLETPWNWSKLRQRIVRSQLTGLGSPVGQLVSSMVLGNKAVDLAADIRDRFIAVGLAHVFAASGFQVSLLLGIALKLTNRLSSKLQLIIGLGTLFTYLGLTGLQASVLRAGLMGCGVLIAIALDTKVKPLGSLLLAATIILLVDPLLIGDVGFQLSFLATLGLIVTSPTLQARLDWLPPAISDLIAVPLAASIWVLPLLSYVFNSLATYSILVNIISTPLITVISLGGMMSAIAALIMPIMGSAIAMTLYYPTLCLIQITKFFTNLPGSSWAVGQISLGALLAIYGLFCLVWLNQWWQRHWWLILGLTVALIVVRIGYSRLNLLQVTVLAAKQEQIIVVQDHGKVILINSGKDNAAKYSVLPFLGQQGINHLDYAIALDSQSNSKSGWLEISAAMPIRYFVNSLPLPIVPDLKGIETQSADQDINLKSIQIAIDSQRAILQLTIKEQIWLILTQSDRQGLDIQEYIQEQNITNKPLVLLSSENTWLSKLLPMLQPQVAIVNNYEIKKYIKEHIAKQALQQMKIYSTQEDGAIRWTPQEGFKTMLETSQSNNIF
jgi:competence protein ComEC